MLAPLQRLFTFTVLGIALPLAAQDQPKADKPKAAKAKKTKSSTTKKKSGKSKAKGTKNTKGAKSDAPK